METRIKMLCKGCGKVHDLPRTDEIPDHILVMACNFCPSCEDNPDDCYEEWPIDESDLPIIENPNQLKLL